jgi:photosystem II stability/assembly factor-like uncharacterized protein
MLKIYCATHEGVLVLTPQGEKWTVASEFLRGRIIDCVEPRPNTPGSVFAGDTHGGLYRTDDGGASWRKLHDGHVRAIKVDPSNDRVVYLGTEPVQLFRSEDAGETWTEIESLQRLPEETRVKLGVAAGAADYDFSKPTFRHGRQEWTFPIAPYVGHITEIFVRPEDPNELWLSIEHGGIARSVDRGESWDDASAGIDYLDIHKLIRLPMAQDCYVVSSARGLYAAADPLDGWSRAENGIDRNYFHELLALPAPANATPPLLVCTGENSPARWEATKGDGQWTAGARGASFALFRSDDGARSWRRIGVGPDLPEEMDPMIWALRSHPTQRRSIFAAVGEVGRGYAMGWAGRGWVLQSDDEGESWRRIADDLPALRQLAVTEE